MAHSTMGRGRVVGDYHLGRKLGSGSFSVVWLGIHRVHGTEVAIKEIVMERLDKKLQESLMSEIIILKRVNHPNIIRLHDIIQLPGKMYLVLEYCEGGDLSFYIQRHSRVPEATAKLFMQQLAAGLKVLRDNNLVHRDLKPQNLLLKTKNSHSLLKIADFGFARSLQPKILAETVCGSPLYMAPEIMQLQKYDAKADLWSVGAILFQLVTGKTPFTGNNHIQLLQNIKKSTELHFPHDIEGLSSDCKDLCQKLLRSNPVERLIFDEFFNHPFLLPEADQLLKCKRPARTIHDISPSECSPSRNVDESPQEDCLPFPLDDESSGTDGSPSYQARRSSLQPKDHSIFHMELGSKHGSAVQRPGSSGVSHGSHRSTDEYLKAHAKPKSNIRSRVTDSLESIDQDYVFVSGFQTETSSSSALRPPVSTGPMPIIGAAINKPCFIESLESQGSAPSGTSQGSMDTGDTKERNNVMRIKSLQRYAAAITDLVNEKVEAGRELEAFSIQLVVLAIWKQAMHICQAQSTSDMEGSCCHDPEDVSSLIKREFLLQVKLAEELARVVESGNVEMPDAMETIYQAALAFGKDGAGDEVRGEVGSAEVLYCKAVELLGFLVVEAPCLALNPPFSLTRLDRERLRAYIEELSVRHFHSRSQRMALLGC